MRLASEVISTLNIITWLVLLIINLLVLYDLMELNALVFSDTIFIIVPVVGLLISIAMVYFFQKRTSVYSIVSQSLFLVIGLILLTVVSASGAG